MGGIRPHEGGEQVISRGDLEQAMERHVDGLMAIPGVTGVAIGELDDGTPCILVLVTELTGAVRRRLPRRLEGHPVRIVESGTIRPLTGDGS